ncbi:MAG: orotate phosphoribosyltransferase [Deltaproteobacteria bacterium]|nr:orotate phosphoribosyltransferase [Deltaproteobacteria bacterium]
MIQKDWERLRQMIFELSYREGTFRLTSGKESDFYIDCKQTTLSAEGAYLCGKLLYNRILQSNISISGVGGMTLGADPLVTAVSVVSFIEGRPIPAFIIRKEAKGHGTGSWIEGKSNIPLGSKVALVEDVVTTGGTLIKAIERTEEEGYKVAQVLTVVDREEGGEKALSNAGYELSSLFTRGDILALVEK